MFDRPDYGLALRRASMVAQGRSQRAIQDRLHRQSAGTDAARPLRHDSEVRRDRSAATGRRTTNAEATPAWSADNRLALHVNEGKRYGEMHVYDVVAASSGIRLVHRVNLTSTGPLAGVDVGGAAWSRDRTELLVLGGASSG